MNIVRNNVKYVLHLDDKYLQNDLRQLINRCLCACSCVGHLHVHAIEQSRN